MLYTYKMISWLRIIDYLILPGIQKQISKEFDIIYLKINSLFETYKMITWLRIIGCLMLPEIQKLFSEEFVIIYLKNKFYVWNIQNDHVTTNHWLHNTPGNWKTIFRRIRYLKFNHINCLRDYNKLMIFFLSAKGGILSTILNKQKIKYPKRANWTQ